MSLAEIMPSNVYRQTHQQEVFPQPVRVRRLEVKSYTVIEPHAANLPAVESAVFTDAVRIRVVVAFLLVALSGLLSLFAVVFEAKLVGTLGAFTLAGAMFFFLAWTTLAEREMSLKDTPN